MFETVRTAYQEDSPDLVLQIAATAHASERWKYDIVDLHTVRGFHANFITTKSVLLVLRLLLSEDRNGQRFKKRA